MQTQTLYIIWNEAYATGIAIIDEQHRGLASLINTFFFHKAEAATDINHILVPTAEMLKNYTQLYFFTLEELMLETGYPDLEFEIQQHKGTMLEMNNVDAKYRSTQDADGFLSFLKGYWTDNACQPENPVIRHIRKHLRITK